jgi:beta-mannosidase
VASERVGDSGSKHQLANSQTRILLDGPDWQCKAYYGEDWRGREGHKPGMRDVRGWLPATVPGSVQHDLWQAGQIPNPYFDENSLLMEWAPQRTWLYRKSFFVDATRRGQRAVLIFEGVDYEAQFFLNGVRLGEHCGMFSPAVFEVGETLHYGADNLLAVALEPAPQEQPQIGRSSQVRTHKTRMNYWWDFCPRMVHLGIWDSVRLEFGGPARVEELYVRPELSSDWQHAEIGIALELSSSQQTTVALVLSLHHEGREVARQEQTIALAHDRTLLEFSFALNQPQLWWPNGYGNQALYEARLGLGEAGSGSTAVVRSQTFGIRQIDFVANEAPERQARPYTLVVNGRKIYINGWNWVPMDVLYGVERPQKLERLLTLARRAHVNMLRVWGGGLIEKESFYDACDRLGILVWQEFIQSSSGVDNEPPTDPDFITRLRREAEVIVRRKRNHPSLAVWGGGNELQAGPERPLGDDHPNLIALRDVVERLDPDRYWLPTSPTGPVFSNSLANIERDPLALHDVHGPWEHQGLTNHFTLYNRGSSLLHSEFGVEGLANLKTLQATIRPDKQWPVSLDNPVWRHLGAWWVKETRWREIFGELPDLPTAVRALQFLQADGLRYALEANRRRLFQNSGSLPWQFNEPYPMAACTSAVDYYAQPKPVYYAVARAYAPLSLTARFPAQAWAGHESFTAEIWLAAAGGTAVAESRLTWQIVSAGGRVYTSGEQQVAAPASRATLLAEINWALGELPEPLFFLDLQLTGDDGGELAANRYLFSRTENLSPLLNAPATSLAVACEPGDSGRVVLHNSGSHTAFFVWLEDGRDLGAAGYLYCDDNHFCLLPGEQRVITVTWAGVPQAERQLQVSGWNFAQVT